MYNLYLEKHEQDILEKFKKKGKKLKYFILTSKSYTWKQKKILTLKYFFQLLAEYATPSRTMWRRFLEEINLVP